MKNGFSQIVIKLDIWCIFLSNDTTMSLFFLSKPIMISKNSPDLSQINFIVKECVNITESEISSKIALLVVIMHIMF